jgi:hypothetical protein
MARNPTLAALSTPELVALILIHLPPHDLLLNAPLVSPTWHQTILTTPVLQEALFFRLSLNPTPITINPFLAPAFPTHFQPSYRYCGSPEIRNLPWSRNAKAFKRHDASWRKMLLWNGGDQEKMKRVKVTSSVQHMSGTYRCTGYLEYEEGMRMGMIWDLTRASCETEEKGQFAMKWREDVFPNMGRSCYLEPARVNGPAPRVSFLNRVRRRLTHREHGIPIQSLNVELRTKLVGEEEKDVLEICLSTWMSCEGRDIFASPPKGLGEEFHGELYQNVVVEFRDTVRIPDSVAFGGSAAAFRQQARRRRGIFG